jgi:preprotein translocase subunit SecD
MIELKHRQLFLVGILVMAILLLVPTIFKISGNSATFPMLLKDSKGETRSGSLLIDGWPFSHPLRLGLDLVGGTHLVYKVRGDEAVASYLRSNVNGIRNQLRDNKIAVTASKLLPSDSIAITLLNESVLERAEKFLQDNFQQFKLTKSSELPNTLLLSLPKEERENLKGRAVSQSLETIRNRIDQFGVAEPLLQRVSIDRILVQMPGVSDVEKVKAIVGKVARLEFRLVPERPTPSDVTLKRITGEPLQVSDEVLMTGDMVDDARLSLSAGSVEVMLNFNSAGARAFRQITKDNIGKRLAIILDNVVYSDPVIQSAILQGSASISGKFSVEEGRQLSLILRAGSLPASLDVIEERTVGPSLGAESTRKGLLAIGAALGIVTLFMVIYYRRSGLIAAFTLVLNLILILAVMATFGATLTLPGLAGLALTIGMAVDANILIFERIRDELKVGLTRDAAVANGFERASRAIIDANVTGIISGVLLYIFGTGPVKGFALTTTVGMVTTLICAVFAARVLFDSLPLESKNELLI